MTATYLTPQFIMIDEGQLMVETEGWQQVDCGCNTTLTNGSPYGDFTITIACCSYDQGNVGIITVSCIGPGETCAYPFTITGDYLGAINTAVKTAFENYTDTQG